MENPWVKIPFGKRHAVFYDRAARSGLAHHLGDAQLEGAIRNPFRTH